VVAAVLDVVPPAIAAGSKLAVLVDCCSAAGPVQITDADLVLSAAAAAQPFVGLVSAAPGQHAGVIDQHSMIHFDSPLTLQRLSLPFCWQEVTRGATYCLLPDPPWAGSMHVHLHLHPCHCHCLRENHYHRWYWHCHCQHLHLYCRQLCRQNIIAE